MKVEVKACAQPTIFKQKSYDSVSNQGRHYYPHFFFLRRNRIQMICQDYTAYNAGSGACIHSGHLTPSSMLFPLNS